MKLYFCGDIDVVSDGLDIIKNRLSIALDSNGAKVNLKADNDCLEVSEKNGEYFISFSKKAEFFRGLSVLIDKIKSGEKDFAVKETAKFDTCGTMIDVSRNGVLTVKTAKDLAERISLMGLNMMMLYTEDTYQMEKYPWFGYMRGAYSKEELKEIDCHCKKLGVELIPCIQTLGHLKMTLRWPYASDMKENASVLLVDEPKTYEFIEEMFKVCRECFSTNRIHIGLDETFGLGEGRYKALHGETSKYELMIKHIKRVVKIAEKYGFDPMMWSDMFFRLGKPQRDYEPTAVLPSDASEKLPENIKMVYWDYGLENTQESKKIIDMHDILGREVVFAGGIWTWNRMIVNMEKTFETARCQLRACKERGIKTVFTTIWGSGSVNAYNIYATLPGLQMYAEQCYYDEVSNEHIEKMFKVCTGYELNAFLTLYVDDFSKEEKEQYKDDHWTCFCVNPSYQHLFNDILIGLMDKTLSGYDFKTRYKNYVRALSELPNQGDLEWLFDIHRKLADILVSKCDIGPRLTTAYRENDHKALEKLCAELGDLFAKYSQFHILYGDIWHRTYKPFGWEPLDMDLANAEARTKWAHHRVEQFLNGDIEKIEELEAERFYFNEVKKPLTEVSWTRGFTSVAYGMN